LYKNKRIIFAQNLRTIPASADEQRLKFLNNSNKQNSSKYRTICKVLCILIGGVTFWYTVSVSDTKKIFLVI